MRIDQRHEAGRRDMLSVAREPQAAQNPQSSQMPEAKAPDKQEALRLAVEREQAVSVQWEPGQIMILRFTDKATGSLIQQFPCEEVVKVFHAIQQLLHEGSSKKQLETDL